MTDDWLGGIVGMGLESDVHRSIPWSRPTADLVTQRNLCQPTYPPKASLVPVHTEVQEILPSQVSVKLWCVIGSYRVTA